MNLRAGWDSPSPRALARERVARRREVTSCARPETSCHAVSHSGVEVPKGFGQLALYDRDERGGIHRPSQPLVVASPMGVDVMC